MNGATRTGSASLGIFDVGNWDIAGAGDFNGDGKADLVWQRRTTGQRVLWFMNGAIRTGSASLGIVDVKLEHCRRRRLQRRRQSRSGLTAPHHRPAGALVHERRHPHQLPQPRHRRRQLEHRASLNLAQSSSPPIQRPLNCC